MSDDDGERARLEAIVFGRPDSRTAEIRDAAAAELRRLLDAERPGEPETAGLGHPEVLHSELERAGLDQAQLDQTELDGARLTPPEREEPSHRPAPVRRRVATIALALIVGAAAVIGAIQLTALMPTDSLAVFKDPQTDKGLEFADDISDLNAFPATVRFVGSEAGYDVYVYRSEAPAAPPFNQPQVCMAVQADTMAIVGNSCSSAVQFATSGASARFGSGGTWTEVSWNIRSGVVVTSRTNPPIPPAISVFDEPQDDADRQELLFLPDLRADLQESARFLGSNGGYSLLVYRGDDGEVCLAVYVRSTTQLTAETTCVTEGTFRIDGIALGYPASDPIVQVSWGPEPGFAISPR